MGWPPEELWNTSRFSGCEERNPAASASVKGQGGSARARIETENGKCAVSLERGTKKIGNFDDVHLRLVKKVHFSSYLAWRNDSFAENLVTTDAKDEFAM